MTNEVWDYVFLGKPLPQASQIPLDTLHKLRNAFLYVTASMNYVCMLVFNRAIALQLDMLNITTY